MKSPTIAAKMKTITGIKARRAVTGARMRKTRMSLGMRMRMFLGWEGHLTLNLVIN